MGNVCTTLCRYDEKRSKESDKKLRTVEIMAPNRNARVKIAQETLRIIQDGAYTMVDGDRVDIADDLEKSVDESKVYVVSELDSLRKSVAVPNSNETEFEVTEEKSIASCARLTTELKGARVGLLNFASAKNPCGGMQRGSQAQEESIAICSTLHPTQVKFQTEYYDFNRAFCKQADGELYSDTLIYSPNVVVFREDDNLTKLDEPFKIDVITCPAVNKGLALRTRSPEDIEAAMRRRLENVLAVATERNIDILVLGAWGCGVFKNEPEDIARLFSDFLTGNGRFSHAFRKVVFAIYGSVDNFNAFKRLFQK